MRSWVRRIGDWWLNLRRTLTPASVTLIIAGIVSLNIVWGLPWVGLFSGTASLLFLGWVANRLCKPRLVARVKSPPWVRAGESVSVRVYLQNRFWLPAMDLRVGLEDPQQVERWLVSTRPPALVESFSAIGPGESDSFEQRLEYPSRGLYPLPAVRVESLFPFHLFRHSTRLKTDQQIAVAPQRIDNEAGRELSAVRELLHGVRRQRFQGESLQYVGSREYQVGVPVRRWDFASWARLGKPIYREYSPPTSLELSLVLDTTEPLDGAASRRDSLGNHTDRRPHRQTSQEPFERLLSLAVTVLEDLLDSGVGVELHIHPHCRSQRGNQLSFEPVQVYPRGDLAEAMTTLAQSQAVRPLSEESVSKLIEEQPAGRPTIVLSRRPRPFTLPVRPRLVWVCSETLEQTTSLRQVPTGMANSGAAETESA